MPKSPAFEFYLMELFRTKHELSQQKICLRALSIDSSWQANTATPGWTGTRDLLYKRPSLGAQVAQLVEQRTENPCVGGSIPPLGTIKYFSNSNTLESRVRIGCGRVVLQSARNRSQAFLSIPIGSKTFFATKLRLKQ
jgi:hypothetical protein